MAGDQMMEVLKLLGHVGQQTHAALCHLEHCLAHPFLLEMAVEHQLQAGHWGAGRERWPRGTRDKSPRSMSSSLLLLHDQHLRTEAATSA